MDTPVATKKILVTGAAGYIGSLLVPALLQRGHRVIAVDNFLYRQTSLLDCCHYDALTLVRGDVRDLDTLAIEESFVWDTNDWWDVHEFIGSADGRWFAGLFDDADVVRLRQMVDGVPVLDLEYVEDSACDTDMNVVMTGGGQFIEIQGTGEESTFDDAQLQEMLALARAGIRRLTKFQRAALASDWPFRD